MEAFIALEKYIVKEERDFGVGVPVTLAEEIAEYESTRRKGVASYNNWLRIDVPAAGMFIDVSKSVKEQSAEVSKLLMSKELITSVFVHEARILISRMDSMNSGQMSLSNANKIINDFINEKREFLMKMSSGQDLFSFINSKCITHDRGKSSALLYSHGIKGARYDDATGEHFFLFNANQDIKILQCRNGRLFNANLKR